MKDRFGREIEYLRLSVTELCNLRCKYCMPSEGVAKKKPEEMLTEEEMIDLVTASSEIGIKKVRITGGEPLVKKNILSICKKIKEIENIKELCLTTNATMLDKFAYLLKESGVDRLNISLDTLDPLKYQEITRVGNLKDAIKGIEKALEVGFKKIKINTVLIGGFNDDEIEALAKLTKKYPIDVRFIELMPMLDQKLFSKEAYIPVSSVAKKLENLAELEKDKGVAKRYRLDGALGEIGLISPLSSYFCSSCNRIRVTADGKIKPCLHSRQEINIKGMDKEKMKETLIEAILSKPQCHGQLSYDKKSEAARNMNQIGG